MTGSLRVELWGAWSGARRALRITEGVRELSHVLCAAQAISGVSHGYGAQGWSVRAIFLNAGGSKGRGRGFVACFGTGQDLLCPGGSTQGTWPVSELD